jgi:Lrp/AsnC family transcriptional regulator of lysine biosynthesis
MRAPDDNDVKILETLKKNARTPYTSIARDLGISEAAVRKRIERLIRLGIIKRFTIEYELENEVRALVFVKTTPPIPTPEISKKIVKIQGVEMALETTGEFDVVVLVRGPNIASINRSIDEIRSIQGVSGTNSAIILRLWY